MTREPNTTVTAGKYVFISISMVVSLVGAGFGFYTATQLASSRRGTLGNTRLESELGGKMACNLLSMTPYKDYDYELARHAMKYRPVTGGDPQGAWRKLVLSTVASAGTIGHVPVALASLQSMVHAIERESMDIFYAIHVLDMEGDTSCRRLHRQGFGHWCVQPLTQQSCFKGLSLASNVLATKLITTLFMVSRGIDVLYIDVRSPIIPSAFLADVASSVAPLGADYIVLAESSTSMSLFTSNMTFMKSSKSSAQCLDVSVGALRAAQQPLTTVADNDNLAFIKRIALESRARTILHVDDALSQCIKRFNLTFAMVSSKNTSALHR